MVVDIGGGTCDVAVISLGGIVYGDSLRIAGNRFDADIEAYIKSEYNLMIGERTSESIKTTVGAAFTGARNLTMDVRGRDVVSGLPKNQVFGTGTVLDTARLRYLIGEYLGVATKNIHAYIMGEHGDSSFVPWNYANVGCKSIIDVMEDNHHSIQKLNEIHQGVVNAAYEIIDKKKATYYGIGVALSRIVKAILDNENSILTISTYLDNKYGQNDVYIGVPAIINSNGVREIVELKLNYEEQAKLDNSCKIIKDIRKQAIDRIIKN